MSRKVMRSYGRYSTPFEDGAEARFGSAVPISGSYEASPLRRHSAVS